MSSIEELTQQLVDNILTQKEDWKIRNEFYCNIKTEQKFSFDSFNEEQNKKLQSEIIVEKREFDIKISEEAYRRALAFYATKDIYNIQLDTNNIPRLDSIKINEEKELENLIIHNLNN